MLVVINDGFIMDHHMYDSTHNNNLYYFEKCFFVCGTWEWVAANGLYLTRNALNEIISDIEEWYEYRDVQIQKHSTADPEFIKWKLESMIVETVYDGLKLGSPFVATLIESKLQGLKTPRVVSVVDKYEPTTNESLPWYGNKIINMFNLAPASVVELHKILLNKNRIGIRCELSNGSVILIPDTLSSVDKMIYFKRDFVESLDVLKVIIARTLSEKGYTQLDICALMGVSQSKVSSLLHRNDVSFNKDLIIEYGNSLTTIDDIKEGCLYKINQHDNIWLKTRYIGYYDGFYHFIVISEDRQIKISDADKSKCKIRRFN